MNQSSKRIQQMLYNMESPGEKICSPINALLLSTFKSWIWSLSFFLGEDILSFVHPRQRRQKMLSLKLNLDYGIQA